MTEKRDEWSFLRLRAAQLYEEGDAKAALRLMKRINREQVRLLEQENGANVNEPKIVSTLVR